MDPMRTKNSNLSKKTPFDSSDNSPLVDITGNFYFLAAGPLGQPTFIIGQGWPNIVCAIILPRRRTYVRRQALEGGRRAQAHRRRQHL